MGMGSCVKYSTYLPCAVIATELHPSYIIPFITHSSALTYTYTTIVHLHQRKKQGYKFDIFLKRGIQTNGALGK